jgi:hypothetical protein
MKTYVKNRVKPEGEDFGEDSSPESGKDSCE